MHTIPEDTGDNTGLYATNGTMYVTRLDLNASEDTVDNTNLFPLDGTMSIIRFDLDSGEDILHSTITIDDGMKTSVGSAIPFTILDTDVPDDAEFLVYVTAVGSGFAGTGLKVAVTGEKVT